MIPRTEALAMKARAKAATRSIPMGSTETRRLAREQRGTLHDIAFTDVPALVGSLEEMATHAERLSWMLPTDLPAHFSASEVRIIKAARAAIAAYRREGGA